MVWFAPKEKNTVQKVARIMADLKLPHELVQADHMKSRYPSLNYGSDFLCLIDPTAGLLYADRCVKALRVCENKREKTTKNVPGRISRQWRNTSRWTSCCWRLAWNRQSHCHVRKWQHFHSKQAHRLRRALVGSIRTELPQFALAASGLIFLSIQRQIYFAAYGRQSLLLD